MYQLPNHKVFVSFHHDDQDYKDYFVRFAGSEFIDKSVGDGDIDDGYLSTETIRQKIRDDFIRDATVTVVLIGPCTWQRKHVDWEIGSSLRDTKQNSRCGLLGILLPDHPDYGSEPINLHLVPPRLADNCRGNDPYALIYNNLFSQISDVRGWIHRAFERRYIADPDNGRRQFVQNKSGYCAGGWSD